MRNAAVLDGVTRDTLNTVCVEAAPGGEVVNAKAVLVEEAGRVDVVGTVYVTTLTGGGFAEEDGGAAALDETIIGVAVSLDETIISGAVSLDETLVEENIGVVELCKNVV